ncbi:MAG: DEAD/DEAH box helicase [Deltaproteobacteria bacterium]|jgi:ATP-dependent Lhr-like helicase|nr:DEAD/DEAH box helicase [Deltaproteobacteria bacterium]
MSGSTAFNLLHEKIQKWVWQQAWSSLREIQEKAIDPVLSRSCDLILSASTAAGKTEAAFLPALSNLAFTPPIGLGILYISPLKALINDQFRRLESLGEAVNLPVTPWHGDILQSVKNKLIKKPSGLILITPESLESLILNKAPWCLKAMADLRYVIVDEFHAFVGSERGRQLQSLLHRLDTFLGLITPRLALSATLGEMDKMAQALRPQGQYPYQIIESKASGAEVQLQLRGYVDSQSSNSSKETKSPPDSNSPKESKSPEASNSPPASELVADDLFKLLRGGSHLVFANSRQKTESLSVALSERCQKIGVPNEFYPHHGSLSREIREDLEKRLQEGKKPTTAVCTMTLELGIDIGHVNSVAQVGSPQSVASLRQRLGRSGRRGEPAILRFFITESFLTKNSHIGDRLRLDTFQSVAMVSLLLKRWYEPANTRQYHFSTLVQQTLSVIGQHGGVRANQLWSLLCGTGPFSLVSQENYVEFLRALRQKDLITQTQDGQIVLGYKGEQTVSNYTFYSAFATPEEYRLESGGAFLGSIPISNSLAVGQNLIFAGRKWEVLEVSTEAKRIILKPAAGGIVPTFSGTGQMLDGKIRKEMFEVYDSEDLPIYLNKTARESFNEGRQTFRDLNLKDKAIIEIGKTTHILPWLGDRAINVITVLLRGQGLKADSYNGVIDILDCSKEKVVSAIKTIIGQPKPEVTQLSANFVNTIIEKNDPFVPENLRYLDYSSKFLDLESSWQWLLKWA